MSWEFLGCGSDNKLRRLVLDLVVDGTLPGNRRVFFGDRALFQVVRAVQHC